MLKSGHHLIFIFQSHFYYLFSTLTWLSSHFIWSYLGIIHYLYCFPFCSFSLLISLNVFSFTIMQWSILEQPISRETHKVWNRFKSWAGQLVLIIGSINIDILILSTPPLLIYEIYIFPCWQCKKAYSVWIFH